MDLFPDTVIKRELEENMYSPVILNYGAGTNSKAIAIKYVEMAMQIDLILFADTGGERDSTYKDIEHFSDWLESKGYPRITTVKKVKRDGSIYTLEQNCLDKKMLPSIAYGFKSCSQKYKAAPMDKFINHWKPAVDCWKKGGKVTKIIGYDADEERRVTHFMNRPEDPKYNFIFPLFEWDFGREECIEIIADVGLPQPGKSACFFCPSSKKKEVKELKFMHPELYNRAINMERNAKDNLTSVKGLGRNYAWEDYIKIEESQFDMFSESYIEIDCGCYDG